jgi:peptide/nickel transport system substrate-binding protein
MSLWIASLFLSAVGNPMLVGQTMMAGGLDPTAGSTGWALTSHGIAEKLFTVAEDGTIVGQVARSVEKLSTLVWQVNLKCDYKFSDGTDLTATHVTAALARLNAVEGHGAQSSLGNMCMTVVDDYTFTIESERATPVMASVLAEWPFVIFLESGSDFIFTGPYKVETFQEGVQMVLAPNEHYPRAAERERLTILKYANGESLADAIEAGDVDMAFHLPVDRLTDLRAADGVTIKSFPVGYQYMMFHNTRASRGPLSDVLVRRAVDTVLDRTALSQALMGGDATRSFFPENNPYYHEPEDTELHGEGDAAGALLDQAGWVRSGGTTGNREKDGVPLTLHLVAYPQRPGLAIMHPLVGEALESLGITVQMTLTSGDGWAELDAIMGMCENPCERTFDLLMWAQHTLPAGDPAWFLNHFFRSDGGGNHAGLNSSEVDTLIDALSTAETDTARVAAAAAAHSAILEQVPVSILVTPDWHVGVRSRLTDYQPWGSDYYIIRHDLGLTAQSGVVTDDYGCSASSAPSASSSDSCFTSSTMAPSASSTMAPSASEQSDSGADKVVPSGMLAASVFLLGWSL